MKIDFDYLQRFIDAVDLELNDKYRIENKAEYIKKCFDSLLARTYRNPEIIVVNNGLADNTSELAGW